MITRAVVALDRAQRPSGVPGPTERVDAAGDGDEQPGQLARVLTATDLARGTVMGLSSFASKPVEEVAAAGPATFFQVYWVGTREDMAAHLERARAGTPQTRSVTAPGRRVEERA